MEFWLVCTNLFMVKGIKQSTEIPYLENIFGTAAVLASCYLCKGKETAKSLHCVTLHTFLAKETAMHTYSQAHRRQHSPIFVSRHRFRSKPSRRITMTHAKTKNHLLRSLLPPAFFFFLNGATVTAHCSPFYCTPQESPPAQ